MDRAEYVFYKLAQSKNLIKNPKSYVKPGQKSITQEGNIYETEIGASEGQNKNTKNVPNASTLPYDYTGFSRNAMQYAGENKSDIPIYYGPYNKSYRQALDNNNAVWGWKGLNNIQQQDRVVNNQFTKPTRTEKIIPVEGSKINTNVSTINPPLNTDMTLKKVNPIEERGFDSLPVSTLTSLGAGALVTNALANSRDLGFNTSNMSGKDINNLNPFARQIATMRASFEGIPNNPYPNQGESAGFLATIFGGIPTYVGARNIFDKVKVGNNLTLGSYLNENAANITNKALEAIGLGFLLPKKTYTPDNSWQADVDARNREIYEKMKNGGFEDMMNPEFKAKYGQ